VSLPLTISFPKNKLFFFFPLYPCCSFLRVGVRERVRENVSVSRTPGCNSLGARALQSVLCGNHCSEKENHCYRTISCCVNREDVTENVTYDDHFSSRFARGITAARGATARAGRICRIVNVTEMREEQERMLTDYMEFLR